MEIIQTSAKDPRLATLFAAHLAHSAAWSPPESCHTLSPDTLAEGDALVWAAMDGGVPLGMGALQIDGAEGEIKSMHILENQRGKGIGRALLDAILAEAERRGLSVLRLETGAHAPYAAARALYEGAGFEVCPPFGAYHLAPYSQYYEKRLLAAAELEASP
ncbi:MAG: GNAT family N-acetyltransferase [Pseudomonadota bacterium]